MTVSVVMLSQTPILWESGVGSDVMKPIAAPRVGGMITSSVHVLILVAVFFAKMKERTLKIGRNVGDGDAVGMRPYRIIRFSPAGEVYRVRSVNSCGDFSLR